MEGGEVVEDHYKVLGLPSGVEGSRLTIEKIRGAYKLKALETHPDKNPGDPNADLKFQKIKSSYEVLINVESRVLFDDCLRRERIKRQQFEFLCRNQNNSSSGAWGVKRREMASELNERVKRRKASYPVAKAGEEEEEWVKKKLLEQIAEVQESSGAAGLDMEKVLRVTWDAGMVGGVDYYSADRLRDLFRKFGGVVDVLIWSLTAINRNLEEKPKGSAAQTCFFC
ncbi:hypothetical protein Ancab_021789 [Ancistrocladus abbreviatus]